jgi:glycosyltransferase involved in cell wall biosynthesis
MSLDKQTKPIVSVIIPTFKRVNYLYSTLICFVNQKTEIIIIDSGDDETGLLVAKFQKSYPGITCKKIQSVKNKDAAPISSDIPLFLDNDMPVLPEFVEYPDSSVLIFRLRSYFICHYNQCKNTALVKNEDRVDNFNKEG